MTKLLIKYKEKNIYSQNNNQIDFIHIPMYDPKEYPNYYNPIYVLRNFERYLENKLKNK